MRKSEIDSAQIQNQILGNLRRRQIIQQKEAGVFGLKLIKVANAN